MKQLSRAAAAGLAGWGTVRLAGADRFRCLEAAAVPVLSFTPQAALAALAGSVLLRRKGAAATAALTGAALTAVTLPRAVRRRRKPWPASSGARASTCCSCRN
jgi:hypothetical protein